MLQAHYAQIKTKLEKQLEQKENLIISVAGK